MTYRFQLCLLLAFGLASGVAIAQDKSVRPGINEPFQNPNPSDFIERFEVESREIYNQRQAILEACRIQPGDTIADIGAGTGLFTRMFAKATGPDGKVIAVDIAKTFLDHIESTCKEEKLTKVSMQLCNQESCLLAPNSIDIAFVCDTYHHFEFPRKTSESIYKALKPNGRLLLIDLHRTPGVSTEWAMKHVRADQATVEQEVIASGFVKAKQLDAGLKENYFVVFTKGEAKSSNDSDTPNIAAIHDAMQKMVNEHEVAGAVTMVIDGKSTLHLDAVGQADIANQKPLTTESIYWIASMSKPVTAACVMMMVDEGKLKLDDPISKHLPEMGQLKLADGSPAVITVEQLLNHTSGMSELPGQEGYLTPTLAEAATKYAKLPVQFRPGSKWQYSQTSINTAARIVEVLSGLTFDKFVEQRLFQPLGMKDTTFYLTDAQMSRLAKSYSRESDGSLQESPIWLLAGKAPTDRNRLPAANGGLFSTVNDYATFCQMLINEGELNGVRILTKESVKQLRTPTTDDLTTGFTNGNAWGVGCCVVKQPQGATQALSAGSFGHGGAYGTQAWIDPVKKRAYLLMVQRANFPNADDSKVRKEFQRLAAEALDK